SILHHPNLILSPSVSITEFNPSNHWWVFKNLSHGSVNLVISSQGKPKFETHETDPPKKKKWQTKKRLKLQRKKEKEKRRSANKRDPRRIGVKGKKSRQRFTNAEERIKYKLEKAKIKEALLIERLMRYEVPKLQGPVVEPHDLTGEERFYMKKMAQKGSNYVPVGRRGIFGGVILNMHMHWKKHETVKVICKPCKPGQVHEYAEDIARLSGGTPIHIIGYDTIIFYRGKDYVQPEVMSPIDTLSKKRFLTEFAIASSSNALRHIALYGDPSSRNPSLVLGYPRKGAESKKVGMIEKENFDSTVVELSPDLSGTDAASIDHELPEMEEDEDEDLPVSESGHELSVREEDECEHLPVSESDHELPEVEEDEDEELPVSELGYEIPEREENDEEDLPVSELDFGYDDLDVKSGTINTVFSIPIIGFKGTGDEESSTWLRSLRKLGKLGQNGLI
ncbi:hypothetical protein RJ639_013264, partial [Escallonia herrerae]